MGSESVVNSVTLPDNAFVPGESITCGAAQVAGLAGELDPATCTVYSSLARLPTTCACQATPASDSAADTDATDATVDATADGNKDGTDAPSTTAAVMTTDPPSPAVTTAVTTAAPVLAVAV